MQACTRRYGFEKTVIGPAFVSNTADWRFSRSCGPVYRCCSIYVKIWLVSAKTFLPAQRLPSPIIRMLLYRSPVQICQHTFCPTLDPRSTSTYRMTSERNLLIFGEDVQPPRQAGSRSVVEKDRLGEPKLFGYELLLCL